MAALFYSFVINLLTTVTPFSSCLYLPSFTVISNLNLFYSFSYSILTKASTFSFSNR